MSRKAIFACLSVLFAVLLCLANAWADAAPDGETVLYTTLGPHDEYDTHDAWQVSGHDYANQVIAMPFSPNDTRKIANAVLALSHFAGNNSPLSVYLESDNAGLPGTILDTLTQVGVIPDAPGRLVQFDCSICPLLSKGTQYWIVAVEADAGSQQGWQHSYNDQQGSFAYNSIGSPTGPWNPFDNQTLAGFRVDGDNGIDPVPEPGTVLMLGSGVVAALAGLRRKLNL